MHKIARFNKAIQVRIQKLPFHFRSFR